MVKYIVLKRIVIKGQCKCCAWMLHSCDLFVKYRFLKTDELIEHMRCDHSKDIFITHKSFPSMPDFKSWKEEYEISSQSFFTLNSAPKRRIGYQSYYYYCNRSGTYFSKGKGKRGLKIQGSSKINSHCTSFIRVKKFDDDGTVQVEMCEHHTHEVELAHLPIPQSTKEMVAAKLADGVTITSIVDSVRINAVSDGHLNRKHLLCRQDVHNI